MTVLGHDGKLVLEMFVSWIKSLPHAIKGPYGGNGGYLDCVSASVVRLSEPKRGGSVRAQGGDRTGKVSTGVGAEFEFDCGGRGRGTGRTGYPLLVPWSWSWS